METVTDFIFLGFKITADGDFSHEIKRHLLLERKGMTNLDSILKSRDITLPTKVCRVKAMVFPMVMYGCQSWTIKKAEHQRIDTLKLWCQRRLLRVPWTIRRSNTCKETAACQASLSFTISQSLLKLISIKLAMPLNHLVLCCPFSLLTSMFLSMRVFSMGKMPQKKKITGRYHR